MRAYCVAIVAVDLETVEQWARERNLNWSGAGDLVALPQVVTLIREGVDLANQRLARWEQVRDVILALPTFTIENGLLTSTGKVDARPC